MSTMTLTLADFLLARIAEEEAPTGYDGPHYLDCDTLVPPGFPCDCGLPERMEREREAKRRTVALHAEVWTAPWTDDSVQRRYAARGRTAGLYAALAELASVYADHPDYREEWRP